MSELVDILVDAAGCGGGSLKRIISRSLGPVARRSLGVSDDEVFPIPLMRASLPTRGRARERAQKRRPALALANTILAAFNYQYLGRERAACTCLSPTAAQKRAQRCVFEAAQSFLRGAPGPSGEMAIREFLQVPGLYAGSCHALPLGL